MKTTSKEVVFFVFLDKVLAASKEAAFLLCFFYGLHLTDSFVASEMKGDII